MGGYLSYEVAIRYKKSVYSTLLPVTIIVVTLQFGGI